MYTVAHSALRMGVVAMNTYRVVYGINSWIVKKLCKVDTASQTAGFNK